MRKTIIAAAALAAAILPLAPGAQARVVGSDIYGAWRVTAEEDDKSHRRMCSVGQEFYGEGTKVYLAPGPDGFFLWITNTAWMLPAGTYTATISAVGYSRQVKGASVDGEGLFFALGFDASFFTAFRNMPTMAVTINTKRFDLLLTGSREAIDALAACNKAFVEPASNPFASSSNTNPFK